MHWSKTWSASGLFSLSLKKRIWINFDLKWYILYLISDICIWYGDSILFLHLFAVSIFSPFLSKAQIHNSYGVVCINCLECEQEPCGQFLSKDDIPEHVRGPFLCNECNKFLTKSTFIPIHSFMEHLHIIKYLLFKWLKIRYYIFFTTMMSNRG